ncbi:LysR family transcriptional regulator [Rhodocyclaceae bacterium SMB388]
MTLKEIEAFYWTAALSSFSGAATHLHITQSSLSKRVAELEESIGSQLFDRSSKKVQLTETGKRLLPVARKMLDLIESMHMKAKATTRLTGDCRFGISELAALTWLPALVNEVRQKQPGLRLEPYVDLARALEKRVMRGELDFAVAPGPAESEAAASDQIAAIEFTWIAAPGRISPGEVLTPAELLKYPLITMTEGSGVTRAFERWAVEQGVSAQRIVSCNSLMGIIGLTIADVGISFLPSRFIQHWLDRGSLVALRSVPPLPTVTYCYMYRKDDNRALLKEMKQLVNLAVGSSGWAIPASLV